MANEADSVDLLRRNRNPDGGFGLHPTAPSEVEPTALAALVLDDQRARVWLAGRQRDDGSFGLIGGRFADEAATALATLALPAGRAQEVALDRLESTRGRFVAATAAIPIDEGAVGWSWTKGTASWVEPTGRALWALRVLRPGSAAVADASALLLDREAVGGGWNYGNREVLGERLPPFAQTTASALIGLAGVQPELEARGLRVLRGLWRSDSPGPLTLAMSAVAFDIHGDHGTAEEIRAALREQVATTTLELDAVTWAWIALTDGDRVPGRIG